jgi:hypothetical protein
MQLLHFRLSRSVAEALIKECNPSLNNLLDWWPQDEAVFLGHFKIDQSKFIDRFGGFSCTSPGYKRSGREATQLSADTTELLARNYRWIHSGLSSLSQPPALVSPVTFHNLFLNSDYGFAYSRQKIQVSY